MDKKHVIDIKQTIIGNLLTFLCWITALIILIGGYILIQRLENEVNFVLGLLIITISTLKIINLTHFRVWLK